MTSRAHAGVFSKLRTLVVSQTLPLSSSIGLCELVDPLNAPETIRDRGLGRRASGTS